MVSYKKPSRSRSEVLSNVFGSRSESTVGELATIAAFLQPHRVRLLRIVDFRIDPAVRACFGADDVLQDVMFCAAKRLDDIAKLRDGPPEQQFSFLYKLTIATYIDKWRFETRGIRDRRREQPWPEDSSMQLALGLMGSGSTASKSLTRQQLCVQVHAALALLKPADRRILELRHFDELNLVEAAAVLEISHDAATKRYSRAMQRLRKIWMNIEPSRFPAIDTDPSRERPL